MHITPAAADVPETCFAIDMFVHLPEDLYSVHAGHGEMQPMPDMHQLSSHASPYGAVGQFDAAGSMQGGSGSMQPISAPQHGGMQYGSMSMPNSGSDSGHFQQPAMPMHSGGQPSSGMPTMQQRQYYQQQLQQAQHQRQPSGGALYGADTGFGAGGAPFHSGGMHRAASGGTAAVLPGSAPLHMQGFGPPPSGWAQPTQPLLPPPGWLPSEGPSVTLPSAPCAAAMRNPFAAAAPQRSAEAADHLAPPPGVRSSSASGRIQSGGAGGGGPPPRPPAPGVRRTSQGPGLSNLGRAALALNPARNISGGGFGSPDGRGAGGYGPVGGRSPGNEPAYMEDDDAAVASAADVPPPSRLLRTFRSVSAGPAGSGASGGGVQKASAARRRAEARVDALAHVRFRPSLACAAYAACTQLGKLCTEVHCTDMRCPGCSEGVNRQAPAAAHAEAATLRGRAQLSGQEEDAAVASLQTRLGTADLRRLSLENRNHLLEGFIGLTPPASAAGPANATLQRDSGRSGPFSRASAPAWHSGGGGGDGGGSLSPHGDGGGSLPTRPTEVRERLGAAYI